MANSTTANNNNNNNITNNMSDQMIDNEFATSVNPNNTQESTMSESTTASQALNLLNNMPKHESTNATTSIFDNLEDDVAFEYEQTTDGSAVVNVVKGLPMQQHDFNHFTTYGNTSTDVPKSLSLFFNVEHRLVSWNSPRSSQASVLNQRLLQVVEIAAPNTRRK